MGPLGWMLIGFFGVAGLAFIICLIGRDRPTVLTPDGFEHIGGLLFLKDGGLYYNRTTLAKVLGLNEIRNDRARLVQLEIRYAVDGSVKSERLYGSEDQLLTIAYKLGYQV